MAKTSNSMNTLATLKSGATTYRIHRLAPVYEAFPQARRLPFSLKILTALIGSPT